MPKKLVKRNSTFEIFTTNEHLQVDTTNDIDLHVQYMSSKVFSEIVPCFTYKI